MKLQRNESGFSVSIILVIIVLAGIVGLVGWRIQLTKKKTTTASNNVTKTVSTPAKTQTQKKYDLVSAAELVACAQQSAADYVNPPSPVTASWANQAVLECTQTIKGMSETIYGASLPNISAPSASTRLVSWAQIDTSLQQVVQSQWPTASSLKSPNSCVTSDNPATITSDDTFARIPTCIDGGTIGTFWMKSNISWVNIGLEGQFGSTCSTFEKYHMPIEVTSQIPSSSFNGGSICFDDNNIERFVITN